MLLLPPESSLKQVTTTDATGATRVAGFGYRRAPLRAPVLGFRRLWHANHSALT
jgi:hypothetical protein